MGEAHESLLARPDMDCIALNMHKGTAKNACVES